MLAWLSPASSLAYLQTYALPPELADTPRRAHSTCNRMVSIMGDKDMGSADGDDHFDDWLCATEAFSRIPGAIEVDTALFDNL